MAINVQKFGPEEKTEEFFAVKFHPINAENLEKVAVDSEWTHGQVEAARESIAAGVAGRMDFATRADGTGMVFSVEVTEELARKIVTGVSTVKVAADLGNIVDRISPPVISTIYGLSVNRDEGDDYFADVRDSLGDTIYEIHASSDEDLSDHGMRYGEDYLGLQKHLIEMKIIPENAEVYMLPDAERRVEQLLEDFNAVTEAENEADELDDTPGF